MIHTWPGYSPMSFERFQDIYDVMRIEFERDVYIHLPDNFSINICYRPLFNRSGNPDIHILDEDSSLGKIQFLQMQENIYKAGQRIVDMTRALGEHHVFSWPLCDLGIELDIPAWNIRKGKHRPQIRLYAFGHMFCIDLNISRWAKPFANHVSEKEDIFHPDPFCDFFDSLLAVFPENELSHFDKNGIWVAHPILFGKNRGFFPGKDREDAYEYACRIYSILYGSDESSIYTRALLSDCHQIFYQDSEEYKNILQDYIYPDIHIKARIHRMKLEVMEEYSKSLSNKTHF